MSLLLLLRSKGMDLASLLGCIWHKNKNWTKGLLRFPSFKFYINCSSFETLLQKPNFSYYLAVARVTVDSNGSDWLTGLGDDSSFPDKEEKFRVVRPPETVSKRCCRRFPCRSGSVTSCIVTLAVIKTKGYEVFIIVTLKDDSIRLMYKNLRKTDESEQMKMRSK